MARIIHATIGLFPSAWSQESRANQNWLKSWAQTATIPTNSVIDARAAASSTKIRNIVASLGLEHRGNNVPFLFRIQEATNVQFAASPAMVNRPAPNKRPRPKPGPFDPP